MVLKCTHYELEKPKFKLIFQRSVNEIDGDADNNLAENKTNCLVLLTVESAGSEQV